MNRLIRSIPSLINGDKQYNNWLSSKDESTQEKCIRINSHLPTDDPIRLNDVTKIDVIKAQVHEQAASSNIARIYTETAIKLITSYFYFKLDVLLVFKAGRYHYHGSIRCRNNAQSIVESLKGLSTKVRFISDTFLLG